ncbi:hypothetical protein CLOM_g15904, partial [Closterium sp. NIES-68]
LPSSTSSTFSWSSPSTFEHRRCPPGRSSCCASPRESIPSSCSASSTTASPWPSCTPRYSGCSRPDGSPPSYSSVQACQSR